MCFSYPTNLKNECFWIFSLLNWLPANAPSGPFPLCWWHPLHHLLLGPSIPLWSTFQLRASCTSYCHPCPSRRQAWNTWSQVCWGLWKPNADQPAEAVCPGPNQSYSQKKLYIQEQRRNSSQPGEVRQVVREPNRGQVWTVLEAKTRWKA
jgi:hypothetical protein